MKKTKGYKILEYTLLSIVGILVLLSTGESEHQVLWSGGCMLSAAVIARLMVRMGMLND